MKKISVIIPCYNASKYIERCLKALEKQIYKNFSVICIDDASTDLTYNIIQSYAINSNLDIHIIQNSSNCGPAVSRNKGILYARSEFITFCDSDDWYEPNYLSEMVNQLIINDADIVFCGYKIVNKKNSKIEVPLRTKKKKLSQKESFLLDVDSLCMILVKTDVMKKTLLPSIRNGEDMAVIPLLMSKITTSVVVSDCLYNYYRRKSSASETATMDVVDSLVSSFEYIYSNFPKENKRELEYIGIRNLLYPTMITLFSFSNDKIKANMILNFFENKFLNWSKNKYIKKLPIYKRTVLYATKKRYFFIIKLLAYIRKIKN